MIDTRIRELERRARETGDRADWMAYFSSMRNPEKARSKSYELLAQNVPGARLPALDTLVRNGGVWIERDDAKSIVHVHGVMLSPKHNAPQEPYTLSWAQERLQHDESDYQHGNRRYFRQDTASRIMPTLEHVSGLKLVVPTAPERDGTLRALIRAREFGRQKELVNHVVGLMLRDYADYCLTSDRVVYGKKGKFIRAFGREDKEEISIDLRGNNACVRDLQDPQAMIKLFLDTDESIAQVDRRYNGFFGVSEETYLWRITGRGERAVVLGRQEYEGLEIYLDNLYIYRPLRACSRTKVPQ